LLQGALSKHQKACQKSRKRLAGALDVAKAMWAGRKRHRYDLSHDHATLIQPQPALAGLILTPAQLETENLAEPEVRLNLLKYSY
jgi:hypothetical protein